MVMSNAVVTAAPPHRRWRGSHRLMVLLAIPVFFQILWLLNLGVLNLSSSESHGVVVIEEENCLRPRRTSDAALKSLLRPPCKIIVLLF